MVMITLKVDNVLLDEFKEEFPHSDLSECLEIYMKELLDSINIEKEID